MGSETAGDLTYLDGKVPRMHRDQQDLSASIADLIDAEVRRVGDSIVFGASCAAPVPQRLKLSALHFRWDITSENGPSWTITARIDKVVEATVVSSAGFGASTIDGSMTGSLQIRDDAVELRLDVRGLPQFPTTFEWALTSTLRAFRAEPDSPRVEDRVPNGTATEYFGD